MITDRERRALRIAKAAYAHFTHDALQIATEILALEREINEERDNGVTIPVNLQLVPEVKVEEVVVSSSTDAKETPIAETPSIRVAERMPIPREHAIKQVVVREFEEVPY